MHPSHIFNNLHYIWILILWFPLVFFILLNKERFKIDPSIMLLYQKIFKYTSLADQFSSVAQSCPTLCNPMDCRTPGFSVHHQFQKLVQTHVHRVSDAIQPSHPLLSPSPPTFNLSQYQGLFNESVLCIRWPKYWSLSSNKNDKNV